MGKNGNAIAYTATQDAEMMRMAAAGHTVPEIAMAVNELRTEGTKEISVASIRNRMLQIGALTPAMKKHAGKARVVFTDRMRDYVYVHRKWPLRFLTAAVNVELGLHLTEAQTQKLILEAHAELDHRMTEQEFRSEWARLQGILAPEGQVRRKSWLWRWTRLNESRPASGIVFHA